MSVPWKRESKLVCNGFKMTYTDKWGSVGGHAI